MANLSLPLRGAFYYPWYTTGTAPYLGAWTQVTNPWTQFHPKRGYYDSSSTAIIDAHIVDMKYGKFDAGISSWWGQGSKEDTVFSSLLTRASGTGFNWCIYYEAEGNTIAGVTGSPNPTSAQITADLNYITTNYTSHPNYLHIGGKPVIFAFGDGSDDNPSTSVASTTGPAARWSAAVAAATESWYYNLKVYANYTVDNATYPTSGWHQYGPAAPVDVQGTFSQTISPRFWRGDNAASPLTLPLDRPTWQLNVRNMVSGAQDWKLVTSYNEWGEGHAVECCDRPSSSDTGTNTNRVYTGIGWNSTSGYGWLLDDLHNNGVSLAVQNVTNIR